MPQQPNHVERIQNSLMLPARLSHGTTLGVLHELRVAHEQKCYDDLVLDFANVKSAFPNGYAPLAGIIEYYKHNRQVTFDFVNVPSFVTRARVLEPGIPSEDTVHRSSPMNTVWKFSSGEDIQSLVNAYVDNVAKAAECGPGVLQGLEWCLNEVMDNVLQHSLVGHGYVCGQVHRTSKHVAICVYDHGRGIFNSLRNSSHAPANAVDAITIALQEGVTRDRSIGQGNGMWGLHNIVRANSGALNIASGPGYFQLINGHPKTSTVAFLNHENHSTTVDFQIDFDRGISIPEALGGHEPANLRIESLQDEQDNIVYRLADKASGTGTRQSGAAIRNEVLNMLNETSAPFLLDFNGVSIVSSSFADEFIGKLAAKIGFLTFNQRIRIIGMNPTIQAITDRSVVQRLQVGLTPD